METIYDRIKAMSKHELGEFIRTVYLNGQIDGGDSVDDEPWYGAYCLDQPASILDAADWGDFDLRHHGNVEYLKNKHRGGITTHNLVKDVRFIDGFIFDLEEIKKCSNNPEELKYLLDFSINTWKQTKELLLREASSRAAE